MRKTLIAFTMALLLSQLVSQAAPAPSPGYLGQPVYGGKPLPMHLDRKGTDELLQMLNDESVLYRGAAARELGKRKATQAIQPIKKLLTDKSVVMQQQAAIALLELGDMSIMSVLRAQLMDPPWMQATFRLNAAEALARYGDDSGLDIARQELTSESWGIREEALNALAASKNDAMAYAALETGVKDPETHVRRHAVYLLGERPGKRSVELLGFALSDPDYKMRWSAIASLNRNGSRDAIPVLIQALVDTDGTVRRSAAAVLNRITGQNKRTVVSKPEQAGELQADWQAWWEANKDKPLPGEKK
jgi:HEAT repeat protein